MVECENCDTVFEHADELEADEIPEIETADDGGDSPQIRIGTGQRAVWRCGDCGAILGTRSGRAD